MAEKKVEHRTLFPPRFRAEGVRHGYETTLELAKVVLVPKDPRCVYERPPVPKSAMVKVFVRFSNWDAVESPNYYDDPDQELDRFERATRDVERDIVRRFLAWARETGELDVPETTKLSYRRDGGCRCGCSPCYIAGDRRQYDLHIEVDAMVVRLRQ